MPWRFHRQTSALFTSVSYLVSQILEDYGNSHWLMLSFWYSPGVFYILVVVFFLLRDATQSTLLLWQVICLPYIHDVKVSWSHGLKFFRNNLMTGQPRVFTLLDLNMTDLLLREHP